MDDLPPGVIVTPSRPRGPRAILLVILGLGGGALLASFASLSSPLAPILCLVAALALALLAFVRGWNDRVELHSDRLVEHRWGRERTLPLDEVETVEVSLFDPRQGFGAKQSATLIIRPRGAAKVQLQGPHHALEPLLSGLTAALVRRFQGRIERGETVVFPDRAPFPLLISLLLVLFGGALALGLVNVLLSQTPVLSAAKFLRMVCFMAFLGWGLWRTLGRWFASRRSRGLAVSSRGIVPLTAARADAERVVGYREAYGAAGPWTTWGDVQSATLDGYGLRVHCADRAEPVELTASTVNLVVLDRLLADCMRQHRVDALWEHATDVRVAPLDDDDEPAEPARAGDRQRAS